MPDTTADATESKFATPHEAARVLNVSRRTIYRLLKRDELEGRRIGGQWRVPRHVLDGIDDAEVPAV
jgi:excisionase family DNA binding protein